MPKWRRISLSLALGWLFAVVQGQAAPTLHAKPTNSVEVEASKAKRTLVRTLQRHAARQLHAARPRRGAVVLLRVKDGAVLAAADYPGHLPRAESVLWSALAPSASLFKLVTTAALVEQAKLHPDHRVCSEGGEHSLSSAQLEAPKGGKIRCQPFSAIMATSRNAAYARLVTKHLSADVLTDFAERFGFNDTLTEGGPFELGRYRVTAGPLGLARTATGFIGSELSAFGAANLALLIANGGIRKSIHLTCASDGTLPPTEDRVLLATTARRLREMMESVTAHGTAYDAFHDDVGRPRLPHLSIAGKTGTLGSDEGTHSWFTGFAPSRAPEVVVAVLLENGNPWRTTAKSIAAEVLQNYFDGNRDAQDSIKFACDD